MSMKKAFDQTLRDLKRGVNKKVLKVPSIEQKVLDATSNEPWGPHGALLADVAQATRNYHEYQMIMGVLWKRINDTGKNWRHVYKALTVLEYLVANGSERVIDDIREHAYQISTLSDFQYIDSSGRDQGNNVRKKSQSIVALVSDKERIEEVRQKAASNRDKFRSTSAVGGMYRPGSGGYGDDRYDSRYGGRDDDYGRERDGANRDDERYGRYGDSYGRDSEDHYGRDGYRDDESRGRSPSVDDHQRGSRSRSSDRDGDRGYDDDDRNSSRLERKFSEQNIGAPPSYEDAVGASRSPTYSERDGEAASQSSPPAVGAAPQSSSPTANTVQSSPTADATPKSSPAPDNVNLTQVEDGVSSHTNVQADPFDEFDPRGSVSAAPPPSTSQNTEMDLLGSLVDAFSPAPLAIMPASSGASDFEADAGIMASNPTFAAEQTANNVLNQSFDDPFGDSPFRAVPSDELTQPHNFTSETSFQPAVTTMVHPQSAPAASNLEFQDAFPGITYSSSGVSDIQMPPNQQFTSDEPQSLQENDILAGILPPSGPFDTTTSQVSFPASGQPQAPTGQSPTDFGFMPQSAPPAATFSHMGSQDMAVHPGQLTRHGSLPYSAPLTQMSPNVGFQAPNGMSSHQNDDFLGGFLPQAGAPAAPSSPLASSRSTGSLDLVLHQPAVEKKFETKSTVWADTLNRGLVNLNIAGSKTNPLSDIGIDFESLNRKEKRMEKPSTAPANSSVSMGKAMGSGSGMGRAGAGALRPAPNQMMGSGMGMGGPSMGGMGAGMGGGPGVGMGMGSYGSVNQQPMGMGMGMDMGMGMGMGMNMGMNMGPGQGVPMQPSMGQGVPMQPSMGQGVPGQPPHGLAPGSNMGNYQMMGRGGYPPQQTYQYGGGYR